MAGIFLIAIIAAAASMILFYSETDGNKKPYAAQKNRNNFWAVALCALIVRILCFFFFDGHPSDTECFYSWANSVFNGGFSAFYTSDAFTDYPPGYMYVLYVIGFIKNTFDLGAGVTYMLLKLPAVICDILCGYIIYKIADDGCAPRVRNIISLLFLFNPAVIFNSAVWGQVDSVLTLFVLLTLFCLHRGKMYAAYLSFALAIFIKPQALFYAPVLLFGIIENVFLKDFSAQKLLKNLAVGLLSIAAVFALSLPFGVENVISQYQSTINSYNFASVNAYNLWTMLGMNWIEPNFFINMLGTLAVILTVIFSAFIFFSKRPKNRYFYIGAFICFSIFMLSVRMHERYAFPAIALMLCACAVSLGKSEFILFTGISMMQFLNTAYVLFYYDADTYFGSNHLAEIVFSVIGVCLFAFMLIYTRREFIKPAASPAAVADSKKITRTDAYIILAITLIYSAVAFYNLGSRKAPETYAVLSADEPISVDLGENTKISKIMIYTGGAYTNAQNSITVSVSETAGGADYETSSDSAEVFRWNLFDEINTFGRYITLSSSADIDICELAVYDGDGMLVCANPTVDDVLFDEQDTVPDFASYRNGTYFDEIYHARTAYEFINNRSVYEWTHPPLGKIFISLGIRLFGMNPFGWRFFGTLFGVLMLPLIYIFLKKITGKRFLTLCGTLLFTFDFMHFAQSRIATIDVFVTFFIIMMYLFMYRYCTLDATAPLGKKLAALGACGISSGLAIACKWTGIYALAGLCVLFFISFIGKYKGKTEEYKTEMCKTILFCFAAFVAAPLAIYVLSYIPFIRCEGGGFGAIIQNQIDMLTYHGSTVVSATHSFSSPWYQWPIDFRPIWYYSGTNGALSENISSFGNPLVWWAGIPALVYCIYRILKHKDKTALFLTVGYLSQLVPWIPVTRITFIYHYFPCVPFVVLLITYSAYSLYRKNKNVKTYFVIYTICAVVLFAAFYPSLSGAPVNADYVKTYLRWFSSWHLAS